MSISFRCENCTRPYNVSDSLAGKKAKCKDCGVEFRIPTPTAPPAPAKQAKPPASTNHDLFGFDDIPPQKAQFSPVEEEQVLPRRAPATWKPKAQDSRSSGNDGDNLANKLCFKSFSFFVAGIVIYAMPSYGFVLAKGGVGMDPHAQMIIGAIIAALAVLGIIAGTLVAVVNFFRFNELPPVGIGGALTWVLALLGATVWSIGFVDGFQKGFNAQQQAMPAVAQDQDPVAPPIAQPAQPPQGFVPPFNPGGRVGPPRQEVRIALSDGQVRRNTSPTGVSMPGVVVRVNYNLETGRAMGEKYVLMVKSRNSQAKLLSFNLRGSGTLSGTNPVASIDDGPFEAWMELEAFGGQNSRRVSETISLRTVEAPAANPTNPNPPGNRPGMPGPRFGRGPRGFPGGRP